MWGMGVYQLIFCGSLPDMLDFCVYQSWDHIFEIRKVLESKIGLESSNMKIGPLISSQWKTVCDFSYWNDKQSRESQNVQSGKISASSNT